MQWFALSFLMALSACEDEVVQVYNPTDASGDRAAEGGSTRSDASASADGDAAGPTADAAATDEAPARGDALTGGEPQADDGGDAAGD
jgi:hypothetical protein